MTQTKIPYIFMRGGTSRGPYFNRADLPQDLDRLADVLVAVIGSGHPLNIDGIGGGAAVATKVAMLSKSEDEWADIDYFFAQVNVEDKKVDFKPTCGNILSGVAPAAIEMGMITPEGDITEVKILAVNTGAKVVATIQTPDKTLTYEGDTEIASVPNTAAPVALTFMDVVGSATGAFLPTGNVVDEIDGVKITCMDVAMPVVIAKAMDFSLKGYEDAQELDENKAFFAKMESIRQKAGKLMGMGDVKESVVPKFAIIAPAKDGGSLATRYFMPWKTHPSMAVTGAQCIASCALTPDSVAEGLLQRPSSQPATLRLEHPSGMIEVVVEYSSDNGFTPTAAGLVRTARKIADGHVYIPAKIWSGR